MTQSKISVVKFERTSPDYRLLSQFERHPGDMFRFNDLSGILIVVDYEHNILISPMKFDGSGGRVSMVDTHNTNHAYVHPVKLV